MEPVDPARAAFPDWERVPISHAEDFDLRDLWFRPDGTEGWAVGSGGVILHFASGDWHADSMAVPKAVDWNRVAFSPDGEVGFVVGTSGWLARYESGSSNHHWVGSRVGGPSDSLTAVWVDANGQEAFAGGVRGRLLQWSTGTWKSLSLTRLSDTSAVLDVSGNERELWLRDRGAVLAYTRGDFRLIRSLTDFDASDLWNQAPSPALWVAGVSFPPPVAGARRNPLARNRYTIRRVDPAGTDSVNRIPILPRAAWMGSGGTCGIATGRRPQADDRFLYRSVYIANGHSYEWQNPDSLEIHRIWLDQGCKHGWAVGADGLIAQLRMRPRTIEGMREDYGSLAELTGEYAIVLDSGVPRPAVDSLHLVHGTGEVRLQPDLHFSVDSAAHGKIQLKITPTGRESAVPLKNRELRLRLFVSYPGSIPRYPVVYERVGTFTYAREGVWDRFLSKILLSSPLVAVAAALFFCLLVALPFWASARQFVLGAAGSEEQNSYRGRVLGVVLSWRWFRTLCFRPYRKALRSELVKELRDEDGSELERVRCDLPSLARAGAESGSLWRRAVEDIVSDPHALLWLEDERGTRAQQLLKRGALVALDRGVTPILLNLAVPEPLEQQIRNAFERLGQIPTGAPVLWKSTGFVFLLDGSNRDQDPVATDLFIRTQKGRNPVVVGRRHPPVEASSTCHLKVPTGSPPR